MKAKNRELLFLVNTSIALQKIQDTCQEASFTATPESGYRPLIFDRPSHSRRKYLSQRTSQIRERMHSSIDERERPGSLSIISCNKASTSRPSTGNTFGFTTGAIFRSKNLSASTHIKAKSVIGGIGSRPVEKDPYVLLLRKIYSSKTHDLRIQPNLKQENFFVSKLKNNVNSCKICINDCDLGARAVITIVEHLAQGQTKKQMKLINLDKNPIGDHGVIKLSQILPQLQNLQELSLASVNMSSSSAKVLLKTITGHCCLQKLNLSASDGFNRNKINPEGYVEIGAVLTHPLCNLSSLNLSRTGMGEQGFLSFCSAFNTKTNLVFKQIDLSYNQIFLRECSLPALQPQLCNLKVQKLQLQHNNFGDIGAKLFATVLGVLYGRSAISAYFTYLDISSNNIRSAGYDQLCSALPNNKKLEHLHISGNNLGDTGVFASVRHLLLNTWCLKYLSLRHTISCSPEKGSLLIKPLAEGLARNKTLRELDLSCNQFDHAGFVCIFEALSDNSTLKVLKLEGCGIEQNHIEQAYKFMRTAKGLFVLDLSNNNINDKGATLLIKVVTQVHSIYDMNLRKNCINVHLLQDLEYYLAENLAIAEAREDPELIYAKQIASKLQYQKQNLLKEMQMLDRKQRQAKAHIFAIDILQKQATERRKKAQFEAEEQSIVKLQGDVKISLTQQKNRRRSVSTRLNKFLSATQKSTDKTFLT